jgi:hypothetical protein
MPFVFRHWTALLIIIVLAGWALFYLPQTPSYAIFRLKQTVDARNGEAAANYVDFQKVVQNAGREMMQGDNGSDENGGNILGQIIGRAAITFFSGPMAALLRQWSVQQVNDGARQVQMPGAAVVGAVVLLHNDGSRAYTRWTDKKGQVWEVEMTREDSGWKVTEVKNIRQLLEKLHEQQEKELTQPPGFNAPPPPEAQPTPNT